MCNHTHHKIRFVLGSTKKYLFTSLLPLFFLFVALTITSVPVHAEESVIATIAAGTSPDTLAVNPTTNKIYVANNDSNSVTVIDGANNTVSTVVTGVSPNKVAINPVTNKIYVANFSGSNSVTVIDGVTNTTSTITVGRNPYGIAVNPATNKIYVTNYSDNNVSVIDGATSTTSTVAVGTTPYNVAVNPVTNKIYVANWGSNSVTVIDGATNATNTVMVGSNPMALAVNPATNQIYVANYNSNNITVIDGATNSTSTIATGIGPIDIVVNSITNQIYVPNWNSNSITVIDGATNTTSTVAVGSNPRAVAVNPATNKIYVANTYSNNITVIDGATNMTSAVAAGIYPFAIAVNQITNRTYVPNRGSNNVTVIADLSPISPTATVPDAPTIGTAIAGSTKAAVSFTPPANDGGDPIFSYTVSCSPACAPVSGSTSPILVTGLSNVTAYTFTVNATNRVGASAPSAPSNSVVPQAAPSVPTGLIVANVSPKQNNLSWLASVPAMNVAQYKVYRADQKYCPTGPCTQEMPFAGVVATISGSPPATSYSDISSSDIFTSSYKVQACNALGDCSAFSATVFPGGSSYADLVMSVASKTATTVGAGHSFAITNIERNQGSANMTAASNTVKFYLSLDNIITTADIPLTGSRIIAALPLMTSSLSAATMVTVPYSVVPRVYYVGACADVPSVQIETNEANNCKLAGGGLTTPTITVTSAVNLQMSAVSKTATVVGVGKTFTITNTEKNVGTTHMTAASNTVKFYLSLGAVIATTDIPLTGARVITRLLAGQSSSTLATTVTVPLTVAPGVYYVGACADVPSVQIETNELDNCKVALGTINVVRDVDLMMSAVSTTATSVAVGGSFPISNTEKNQGAAAMLTGTTSVINFYLSTDAIITSADILLTGTRTVTALAAGGSSTATTTVTMSNRVVVPGVYYVRACADGSNVQIETLENNNCKTALETISVEAGVDLVMSAVSKVATSVKAGGSFTISNTEKNQGTVATPLIHRVKFYLSMDAIITSTDRLLTTRTVMGLAAGGVSSALTTVTVPATIPIGIYFVGAFADGDDQVLELDENNNARAAGGTIAITL